MSYTIDAQDENAIVFSGHVDGIADSPYDGISLMRNVDITSIPGEAFVNFATSNVMPTNAGPTTATSADAAGDSVTFTASGTIETGMAISFSATTIAGVSTGTVYWVTLNSSTNMQLYTDINRTSLVNITGNGTGTFSVFALGLPRFFVSEGTNINNQYYYLIDANGRVWTNHLTTASGAWIFTGNLVSNGGNVANGNGIVFYQSGTSGWIFAFSNSRIDYLTVTVGGNIGTWTYGWKPADGTTANAPGYLKMSVSAANGLNSHQALLAPDNKVYYCDTNYIGRFYQADPAVTFDPTTPATYIFDQTPVLPGNDISNCLAVLGNNMLIGGSGKIIYPWDTFSQLPLQPIFVAESYIIRMLTVNTNTYVLAGFRGNVYYTNGSQANILKKIPDNVSGTIEPYFQWNGIASSKNQLYVSFQATDNGGGALAGCGGIWGIDLETEALRLVNETTGTSYAVLAQPGIPAGTGLIFGILSGGFYGIYQGIGTPYTGSQAMIDYDIVPIGTMLKPKTFKKVEYKLSTPMVTGESVSIYYRKNLTANTGDGVNGYTLIFTSSGTTGSNILSDTADTNFDNAQWIQLRAVLNSTASAPSYVRLTEIRIRSAEGITA